VLIEGMNKVIQRIKGNKEHSNKENPSKRYQSLAFTNPDRCNIPEDQNFSIRTVDNLKPPSEI
jgi:hypothetical protein